MVTIKIVIEGGVMPGNKIEAQTFVNSEKLRESFYKLLIQVVSPEYFNLEIEMGAGEKNAGKLFKERIQKNHCSLLIDLDGAKDKRMTKIETLELEEYADFVFFMIQKMESWILSQPDSIEKGMSFYKREKRHLLLANDEIFQKHPTEIVHPDDKLNTILSRFYTFKKREKIKKKKYGKLKDAPLFIKNLDANKLRETFEDVENLFGFLEKTMHNKLQM